MGRVVSLEELRALRPGWRRGGRVVGFANGHFDLLHVGHLRYLRAAKGLVDVLLVGVNDDRSVRRLKGEGRPIVPQGERAELVAGLEPVDFVLVFSGDSPSPVLSELEPEVHCKGTDYGTPERVPEFSVVKRYGGRTVLVGDPKDHATTELLSRIRELG